MHRDRKSNSGISAVKMHAKWKFTNEVCANLNVLPLLRLRLERDEKLLLELT